MQMMVPTPKKNMHLIPDSHSKFICASAARLWATEGSDKAAAAADEAEDADEDDDSSADADDDDDDEVEDTLLGRHTSAR